MLEVTCYNHYLCSHRQLILNIRSSLKLGRNLVSVQKCSQSDNCRQQFPQRCKRSAIVVHALKQIGLESKALWTHSSYVQSLNVAQAEKIYFSVCDNSNETTTLMVLYAPWCEHCQELEREVEKLAEGLSYDAMNVQVVALNVDSAISREFCKEALQIQSLPGVLVFPKESQMFYRFKGKKRDADTLLKFLNTACKDTQSHGSWELRSPQSIDSLGDKQLQEVQLPAPFLETIEAATQPTLAITSPVQVPVSIVTRPPLEAVPTRSFIQTLSTLVPPLPPLPTTSQLQGLWPGSGPLVVISWVGALYVFGRLAYQAPLVGELSREIDARLSRMAGLGIQLVHARFLLLLAGAIAQMVYVPKSDSQRTTARAQSGARTSISSQTNGKAPASPPSPPAPALAPPVIPPSHVSSIATSNGVSHSGAGDSARLSVSQQATALSHHSGSSDAAVGTELNAEVQAVDPTELMMLLNENSDVDIVMNIIMARQAAAQEQSRISGLRNGQGSNVQGREDV